MVGNLRILDSGDKVLRAPRPEPEYELGTVARVRVYSGEEFNALMDEYGFWLTVDGSYQSGSVDVLRVIAYPDGSTPTDQAGSDRDESVNYEPDEVNRVEVIDDTGRAYLNRDTEKVLIRFQDDGQTLKVFTPGRESRQVTRPGDSFGKYTSDVDADQ